MFRKIKKNLKKFSIIAGSATILSTSLIALTSCGDLKYGEQIYLAQDHRASIYFNQGDKQIIYIYDLSNTKDVSVARVNYNAANTDLNSSEAKTAISKINPKDVHIQYLLFKTRGKQAYETIPLVGPFDQDIQQKIMISILADCGWGSDDINRILDTN